MIVINTAFVFISALVAATLHSKGFTWTSGFGIKSLNVIAAGINLYAVILAIVAAVAT